MDHEIKYKLLKGYQGISLLNLELGNDFLDMT